MAFSNARTSSRAIAAAAAALNTRLRLIPTSGFESSFADTNKEHTRPKL